ncbi:MAG: hypothetical protein K6B14_03135 [Lachnospiraceae bacterium]|nr:hypothetical protein [Lachnospiraceae bacterium]
MGDNSIFFKNVPMEKIRGESLKISKVSDDVLLERAKENLSHLNVDETSNKLKDLLAHDEMVDAQLYTDAQEGGLYAPENVADKTYETVFRKKLSWSQRKKRGGSFYEKADLTREIRQANEDFQDRRFMGMINRGLKTEQGRTEEYRFAIENTMHSEAVRDLVTYYEGIALKAEATKGRDSSEYKTSQTDSSQAYLLLTSNSQRERDVAYSAVLKKIRETDLKEFYYENDKDFVKKYKEKYEKLRAFSHGLEFLENKSEDMKGGGDLAVARAKSEMLKDILRDYELRMTIIQSPYYAGLAGKDFAEMEPNEILDMEQKTKEPALKEYLAAIRQMKGATSYKKDGKTDIIDTIYADKLKAAYEMDANEGRELLSRVMPELQAAAARKGIELNIQSEYNQAFVKMTLDKALEAFPDMTLKTLRENEPNVGQGASNLFGPDFKRMNEATLDMLEKPEQYGLSTEDVTKLTDYTDRLMKAQAYLNRVDSQNEQSCQWADYWRIANNAYAPEERAQIGLIKKAVKDMQTGLAPELMKAKRDYALLQKEIMDFRCKHGVFVDKDEKHFNNARSAGDTLEPLAVNEAEFKVNDEVTKVSVPLFDVFDLDLLKGKELKPADGVTPEQFQEAVNRMVEAVKPLAGYKYYINDHTDSQGKLVKGHLSGIEGPQLWELEWWSDQLIPVAQKAVNDFRALLKK